MINKYIMGKNINLRDIEIDDADFVLALRLDQIKSKYLHTVKNDVEEQKKYIANYKETNNSWYFIIESKSHERLGTVRIYDIQKNSFCWGSWIIKQGAPSSTAIESALLIYEYAFFKLNFESSHFDVRKDNIKVQLFHERMGAIKINENDLDVFYSYHKKDYLNIKSKYKKWL